MRHVTLRPFALAAGLVVACATGGWADDAEYAGWSCGLLLTSDPSGVVNGNEFTGVVTGGPWAAADATGSGGLSGHPGPADITVHCWIQVNDNRPSHPGQWGHCDFTGSGEASGTCDLLLALDPAADVYVCTRVDMHHSGRHETYEHDADETVPDAQCALAVNMSVCGVQFVVAPDFVTNAAGSSPARDERP